jgi:hypothetical protein
VCAGAPFACACQGLAQLEECEGTLGVCELEIQMLRATIHASNVGQSRRQPRTPLTDAPPLDEAALSATLPPARYDLTWPDSTGLDLT